MEDIDLRTLTDCNFYALNEKSVRNKCYPPNRDNHLNQIHELKCQTVYSEKKKKKKKQKEIV